ncbi:related to cellulase precursor [Armillaria ostoyae]|uniref:Related to cellulase n=1 Tax=Armillaria ostoyae TaxID=47428 RepID=A0A284RNX7_ARMOS|nr:related to cellulase precursor [Armillaria ostoyae]
MTKILYLPLFFVTLRVLAQSTAAQYGQCGGIGWSGGTICPSGWSCSVLNDYYSQCLPGASTIGTPTTSNAGGGSASSTTVTPTTSAAGGSATLAPGYSFIRAVEDPNFHKYLRSEIINTASTAVLGEPADAAQFVITNGQLIQNADGTPLYAIVENMANDTVVMLKMSWSETPATSGTFVFSGDTLEWSIPTITRPQTNAWYVCPDDEGNLDVYVNLGFYSYNTPAGCADETIHAYTGSTATA